MDLVVVDGSNVVNSVGAFVAETDVDDAGLRAYLHGWFDIDRLVMATIRTGRPLLGTVIFHSYKMPGKGRYRFKQSDVDAFWGRQASNPHASCIAVEIPGTQRESASFTCTHCGRENADVEARSEKGIDTAITAYLFETADRWESACIFSIDSDFMPPVHSLRRRGKQVFAAGERGERPTALVRACQSFFDLNLRFVAADVAVYRFFAPGGPLDGLVEELAAGERLTIRIARSIDWHDELDDRRLALEIAIAHPEGDGVAEAIRAEVVRAVARVPNLGPLIHCERRNSALVLATLHGPSTILGGYARHADAVLGDAKWRRFVGDVGDAIDASRIYMNAAQERVRAGRAAVEAAARDDGTAGKTGVPT